MMNKNKKVKNTIKPHEKTRTGKMKRQACTSEWEYKNGKWELDKTDLSEKLKISETSNPIVEDTDDETGDMVLRCGTLSVAPSPRGYVVGNQWVSLAVVAFSLAEGTGDPIVIYDGNEHLCLGGD